MRPTTMLTGIALLLGVSAWTKQSPPKAQETPGAVAPVAPAEATLEQRVAVLEAVLVKQREELAQLKRLAVGLAQGCTQLATSAETARTQGFEAAGPNPAARTALLEGLTGLADAVTKALAPPQPPAKPADRARENDARE